METSDYGFSAAGLPLMMVAAQPSLVAIKGSVRTETVQGKLLPKITAKVIPVINGKLQSALGIVSPFTEEFIGTGVDISLHSSIPVEVDPGKPYLQLQRGWRSARKYQLRCQ